MRRRQQQISNPLGGLGQAMGIAKMVAPFFGPQGMAVGAAAGVADQLTSDNKPPEPANVDPIQNRIQQLQETPQMQIANSIDSLKFIQDPDKRAELAKPLIEANLVARRGRV